MNSYVGHSRQICGVQEYRLSGGKGDGMRMLRVRNGLGLDLEISLDRCADLSVILYKGVNMGYFSPSGYVHPAYFRGLGSDFLRSFTAGFLTTCGLTAVGNPCFDDGEELPLHGTASNLPCERFSVEENDSEIIIKAEIRDASMFTHQLLLCRTYKVSKCRDEITLCDSVFNIASREAPLLLLYHCNMGYPLLSENATVKIPAKSVVPRNDHAAEDIENCLVMEKPQRGYEERCYFHDVLATDGIGKCGIYNPDINKGMVMRFGKDALDCFTEWKMMGEGEYVLGLEPGNCNPDGRAVMREKGILKFIAPGAEYKTNLSFSFVDSEKHFEEEL